MVSPLRFHTLGRDASSDGDGGLEDWYDMGDGNYNYNDYDNGNGNDNDDDDDDGRNTRWCLS